MTKHQILNGRTGRKGALVVGALTSGALLMGGFGQAPKAEATCVSISGLNLGKGCKTAPLSLALALGPNDTAAAINPLTFAYSLGGHTHQIGAPKEFSDAVARLLKFFDPHNWSRGTHGGAGSGDGSRTPPDKDVEKPAGSDKAAAEKKAADDKAAQDKAAQDKAEADYVEADPAVQKAKQALKDTETGIQTYQDMADREGKLIGQGRGSSSDFQFALKLLEASKKNLAGDQQRLEDAKAKAAKAYRADLEKAAADKKAAEDKAAADKAQAGTVKKAADKPQAETHTPESRTTDSDADVPSVPKSVAGAPGVEDQSSAGADGATAKQDSPGPEMTAGPVKTKDSSQVHRPEVPTKGSDGPDGTSHVNEPSGVTHGRDAKGQDGSDAVDAPTGTASKPEATGDTGTDSTPHESDTDH